MIGARSSKRRKNLKLMADGVPAVYIPPIRPLRSNNGRSRAKQISANTSHIDTDNMLIDTSNSARTIECSLIPNQPVKVGEANLFSDSQVEADFAGKIALPQTQASVSGTEHLESVVHLEDLHHTGSRVPTTRSNLAVRLLPPIETSQCTQIDGSSDNLQPPVASNVLLSTADVADVQVSEHIEVAIDVCSEPVDLSSNLQTTNAISVQHDEICNVASTSATIPVVFESHEPIVVSRSSIVPVLPIIAPAIATSNNHPCNQGFLPISEVDWKATVEDAGQNSLKNNNWACNKFDSWHVFMGLSVDVKLEDLDLKEFGNQLSRFFLMVCKSNSQRYPTASLMNIFMSFQSLLIKAQEQRVIRTGVQEPQFDIRKHPFFIGTCRALQTTMVNSRNAGVNTG
jgi:hypothetical protein